MVARDHGPENDEPEAEPAITDEELASWLRREVDDTSDDCPIADVADKVGPGIPLDFIVLRRTSARQRCIYSLNVNCIHCRLNRGDIRLGSIKLKYFNAHKFEDRVKEQPLSVNRNLPTTTGLRLLQPAQLLLDQPRDCGGPPESDTGRTTIEETPIRRTLGILPDATDFWID